MSKIPNNAYLMIIGAMKSGTTTLYSYISQHPNICPCIVKEPEFFSENQGHGANVEQYSELWNFNPDHHKYVLEASTGYTKYPSEPNVANNIKAYGISPTFIYIVRNPFERIESHYNFSINTKWFNPKILITHDRYVSLSNYYIQLEQYCKNFSSKDIMILDFDELVTYPKNLLRFLYNRLKLNYRDLEIDNIIKHKTEKLSVAEAFYAMHPILKPLKNLLPNSVKQLIRRSSPLKQKRKLTEDERLVIYSKLKRDMELFHKHYNFPVMKWGF
jgi:hypothetical protein